ncbi:radical SAM protein [Desulfonatronum thioautotrophicum]|uniref:radical SAM protein n=1 Tax=Desulfonatronum thioautotrophicum TaxID=617001 RepID=UPI000A032647|nr:radical SAM protein [Desulfonatronum thioautotrophicum]
MNYVGYENICRALFYKKIAITKFGSKNIFNKDVLKINWMLTYRCNYNCSYCYGHDNDTGFFHRKQDILKATEKILDLNRSQFEFGLNGGEPTIAPGYLELLKLIATSTKSCSVVTITNLSRKESFFEKIAEMPNASSLRFHCSYHFEDGDFSRFLNNVKILADAGCYVKIIILAHPLFYYAVKSFTKAAESLSAQIKADCQRCDVVLLPIKEKDCNGFYTLLDQRYTNEYRSWLDEKTGFTKNIDGSEKKFLLMEVSDNNTKSIKSELVYLNQSILEKYSFYKFKGMKCMAGYNSIAIDPKGDLSPAVCFRGKKKFGNIFDSEPEFFPDGLICPYEYCTCSADYVLPKYKIS